MDQSVLTCIARHNKTGRDVAVNSWLLTDAATEKPLAYIADMTRRCRSHRDFRLVAGSFTEISDRLAQRQVPQ